MNLSTTLDLGKRLVRREWSARFNHSTTAWLWFGLTPLLMLAAYAFVFGLIFRARVPAGLDVPYALWLAAVLWPWLAFSESILRASQSIVSRSDLLRKISAPRVVFVASCHLANFALHLIGYFVILLILLFFGAEFSISGLFYLVFLLVTLYVFSLGISLIFSSLTVFLRDVEQFLSTFFLFLFFLTPILYSPEILPPNFGFWLKWNPLAYWVHDIRAVLFDSTPILEGNALKIVLISALSFVLGFGFFWRLSPHFEDFL